MSGVGADALLGLRHQFQNAWRTSKPFAIGAIAVTALLHAFAILIAALHDSIQDPALTPARAVPLVAGLWAALALLPALGGGDSDDPMALASVGAGRAFRFATRFASAVTDAGPGLFIPAIALIGAAIAGWSGWIAGLALAWNGLACGQLASAASAALVLRIGPTSTLVVVGGLILGTATVLTASGLGPGTWWEAATEQPGVVLVLLAAGLLALVGALVLNRPAEQTIRTVHAVGIPRWRFAAITVAMLAGVSRSVMARSMLLTAVLTPLLVRSAGQVVTASIAFFVTAAAAAVLGANGFAYDGGSAVWLLGKADRWQLLGSRLITTAVWALVMATVAAASAALVGAAPRLELLPQLVLAAIGAAASGLVPSVRRPTPTDFDSFRAQPAPVASAVGALARSVSLTMIVLATPLAISVGAVAAYTTVALLHARWVIRDPVALAALT